MLHDLHPLAAVHTAQRHIAQSIPCTARARQEWPAGPVVKYAMRPCLAARSDTLTTLDCSGHTTGSSPRSVLGAVQLEATRRVGTPGSREQGRDDVKSRCGPDTGSVARAHKPASSTVKVPKEMMPVPC